jgi:diguanylate cyclase (GGDEF)-like protein
MEHVSVELKRSRRHGLPLAVMLLDIDHFKAVNDNYGHDIGDEVLSQLVNCCQEQLRETDLFARYGGEEFIAALIHTDQAGAQLVCERLREKVKDLCIRTQRGELSLSVSIGLTMLSADDLSIDPLLKRADDALYRAKNAGRDQVVHY